MPLERIMVPSENSLGELPIFVSSGNQKAGVIVIQAAYGPNEGIKHVAENWYSSEFLTVIPDLYRGKVAVNWEDAHHLLKGLDWSGAVKDIQACVNYLQSRGCQKIGVSGFCMGGALSIASSVLVNGIHAAAPFYGIPAKSLADPKLSKTPLQIHMANFDQAKGFSDPEAQKILEDELKESDVKFEFYRYDAEHGFANDINDKRYHKESAEMARERVLEFFKKELF